MKKKTIQNWIPSKQQVYKLNSQYKVIRKGLELIGVLNSIDNSSKEIKLGLSTSQSVQSQSILSIACQAFDYKSFDNISEKTILLAVVRASRRLKLPINKLKTGWRIISTDATIDQPV